MEIQAKPMSSTAGQIRRAISDALGCSGRPMAGGLRWEPDTEPPGIRAATLTGGPGGVHQLDIDLALVTDTGKAAAHAVWGRMAELIGRTEGLAVPLPPSKDNEGRWRLGVRVTVQDVLLDLPRLGRLTRALEAATRTARDLRSLLPEPVAAAGVPERFRELVRPVVPSGLPDSGQGAVGEAVRMNLEMGLCVALAGEPPRPGLELIRLTALMPNLVELRKQVRMDRFPDLVRDLRRSGLTVSAHCGLLKGHVSPYEQGTEIEAMFHDLASDGTAFLAYGTWEELEGRFGVGQGRHHSPLRPVIEILPPAEDADLVQALLAGPETGIDTKAAVRLVDPVLEVWREECAGRASLLEPLVRLATACAPLGGDLAPLLRQAGRDLLDRRCTFGTESEAPAVPRAAWLQNRLNDGVRGDHLARRLRARLLGQDAALGEVLERLSLEVVGQLPSRPIRLLLAGPTGCGKSMACKIVAETLDLPYHYIDAASFDSPYAVRASLAGAATGIVGSQNDGRLARIARRPAVVEVADLDHAPDHVRADLCDFFLRILEEGTLQTGTGRIVRTCPQLLFMFTSNVAYGTDNATVRVGFAKPSRNQVREWVIDRVVRHLGHAFFSRVGEPCMFDEFTTEAASAIAAMEIRALVGRVLQVERVEVAEGVARQVVADMPSLEGGARRVIDAAKRAVVPALKKVRGKPGGAVLVRGQGGQLVVETAGEGRHEAARTPDGSSGRRR